MSFNPCIVIPNYNHGAKISRTVAELRTYGLPIIIVDDGSDYETQHILQTLATQDTLITLARLELNQGKGGAVMHGFALASRAGHTHVLQIDADGQHDIQDVGRFLALGAAHPQDVICGRPIYDDSVPKGRLYGRYITHFWVWVETLSFEIKDSMCGFRLYPLAAVTQLMQKVSLPRRMDFDTAIVVRLFWQGLRFHNLPTRVIYPDDGLSHFRMWRDNVRISRMHTVLTCGMLLRLPMLLSRKLFAGRRYRHWSKLKERGSHWGLRFTAVCYRALGKTVATWLLYPIVTYFFITSPRVRQASADYLRRVREAGADIQAESPGWRQSFRHMMAFARSGLDKLAAWSSPISPQAITFDRQDAFEQLLETGRGAVLIGAHLGNLEMARALASRLPHTTINAVVYTNHAQRFNQVLAQSNHGYGINLMQVAEFGSDTAIVMREKIDRGELLVIVGDRTPPAENGRICEAEFLGAPASFAQGPFILASLLNCPVYLFFCLEENKGYRIHFESFAESIDLPRRERQTALQRYVQQYADRLAYYCIKAPYQWFNFFDFWQKPASASSLQQSTPITS